MSHLLTLYRGQIIYAIIAIATGGLAAWLAVTARVKIAFSSAAHAREAYKMVNEKYETSPLRTTPRFVARSRS